MAWVCLATLRSTSVPSLVIHLLEVHFNQIPKGNDTTGNHREFSDLYSKSSVKFYFLCMFYISSVILYSPAIKDNFL